MRLKLRSRSAVRLPPGVYCLPAHFTLDEVEGTAELLRDLAPDIEEVRRVPWRDAIGSGFPGGMVVVTDMPDAVADVESVVEAAEARYALAPRYVLVRVGPAHDKGFGWLERLVKPAVLSALRRAVHDPEPADKGYALENAPVLKAATLTADPLELRTLVERAIEHRIEHAGDGIGREDYERSLQIVAGARLAERLARLEGDDMRAAFDVLLKEGRGDRNDTTFRQGAAALARVGLAVYSYGDVALGPLARAGGAPGPIRDALVERVSKEAWSASSASRVEPPTESVLQAGALHTRADALVLTVLAEEHEAALQAAGLEGDAGEVTVTEIGERPLRIAIARLRQHAGFVSDKQTAQLIEAMRPSVVAMCGICAGILGKVELGDVIVADAIVGYVARPEHVEVLRRLDTAWRSRVLPAVNGVAVTGDGRFAVSASRDHTLRVWDLGTGQPVRTLEGHTLGVNGVAVTGDGRFAVSASRDHTLRVWDLGTGQAVRTLEGHADSVNGVAVTGDGRFAVSASRDHTLRVWDLGTGQAVRTLEGHTSSVNGVATTADGRFAVSASSDATLKVWDLGAGQAVRTLEGHTHGASGVAVTSGGRLAVSASWDQTLRVWDLRTGQTVRTLEGHTSSVTGVAVTTEGRFVVSASHDRTLKVWDLCTGHLLRTVEGHTDGVNGVAVTAEGHFAVSASSDGTLKVWDLDTGQAVGTLPEHAVRVGALATGLKGHDQPRAVKLLAADTRTILGYELETEALHVIAQANGIVAKGVAGFLGEPPDGAARRAAAQASARWLIAFLAEHLSEATSHEP